MEGLDAMLSEQRHCPNVVYFVAYNAGFATEAFGLEAKPFIESLGVVVVFTDVELYASKADSPALCNGCLHELATETLVTKLLQKPDAENTDVSSGLAHKKRDVAPANDLCAGDCYKVRATGLQQPSVERYGLLPRRSLREGQVLALACDRIYDRVQIGQMYLFCCDDKRTHGV